MEPNTTHFELQNSELILALACAVGTDNSIAIDLLRNSLEEFNYNVEEIKISKRLLKTEIGVEYKNEYERINGLMDRGNDVRKMANKIYSENASEGTEDYSILAQGVANIRYSMRPRDEHSKEAVCQYNTAYIIDSLKHPDEVTKLREIYPAAFYLFAINELEEDRKDNLMWVKNVSRDDAERLIERDMDESEPHGQHTRSVFELADFHLSLKGWKEDGFDLTLASGKNRKKAIDKMISLKKAIIEPQINRILDLMFGYPYFTPTFEEYAMFMAYTSALRSADLSRQVGAVIASPDGNDIIATGANDVPKYGGGQYWPSFEHHDKSGWDIPLGRDHTLKSEDKESGYDPNKREIQILINDIIKHIDFTEGGKANESEAAEVEKSYRKLLLESLNQLTEYGRIVHAEMHAIISSARLGISLKGATMYCTTFPCHNCGRSIIAAGIKRVVYVEPYPKSKTLELYQDSATITEERDKVVFEPFTGIGPRRFFDLFSLNLSAGYDIIRKYTDGSIMDWDRKTARLRHQLFPDSYIGNEHKEASKYRVCISNQIKLEGV